MAYDRELADRIRELLETEPGVTEKAMFGGLAFLVGGHMTVAAGSKGDVMLRCAPDDTETLRARDHVGPMIMSGRAVNGWLRVGAAAVTTRDELGDWVDRAVAYVTTLPPKG